MNGLTTETVLDFYRRDTWGTTNKYCISIGWAEVPDLRWVEEKDVTWIDESEWQVDGCTFTIGDL
jgi:hypothetical protein